MATPDLAGLKEFLNKTDNNDDTELQTYLGASEKAVADRCGPLEPTNFTERVRARNGSFTVSQWPVINVTEVKNLDDVLADITDIDIDNDTGVLCLRYIHGPHVVSYSAGHDPCPDDLEMATYIIGEHLWETQRGKTGARGQFVGMNDDAPVGADSSAMVLRGFAFPRRAMELMLANSKPGFA